MERANTILERTRHQTAPDIEHYQNAVSRAGDASTDLRYHDLSTRHEPTDCRVADVQRVVAALRTWQEWANGDTTTVERLADTARTLTDARGTPQRKLKQALSDAIVTWADTMGVDLHLPEPVGPNREHTGPELGL